ncbi:hypothetical protein D5086_015896 [Populus alba]|uniref:Uncharacterized protein n=1 Tax=Populus alba TaxID=43335 RepID=A0ACC4BSH2_POPAL
MSNVITVTSLLIHHKTTTVLKAQHHLRAISNELGREDSGSARAQKGLSFMEEAKASRQLAKEGVLFDLFHRVVEATTGC